MARRDPPVDPSPSEAEPAADPVVDVLPWAVSVAVHVGLVALACVVIWSTVPEPEREVVVPLAQLSRSEPARLREVAERPLEADLAERRAVVEQERRPLEVDEPEVEEEEIGFEAPAVSASPFDTEPRGPRYEAAFFGVEGGNARRVVFLIDASGSLLDTFPFVLLELKKTIHELSPEQRFTVIFFQGESVIEVPPAGLRPATSEHKRRVSAWLDEPDQVVPRGRTNPLRGLRRALGYRPQVLFLLSDDITGRGRFELDQRVLLEAIEKANRAQTRISTIQFLYRDPLAGVPGKRGTLELIAERTGGRFKFIDGSELRIE